MGRKISMRYAGNRGFTLIEAIVVMAILSVVMLAIMSFIIPTQQSMKMQSNATDVQSNLNLALNVMTKDLLMAGFLVDPAFDPVVTNAACPSYWKGDTATDNMAAGPIFWQGDDITEDTNDLTIRTRVSGNAFAVIDGVAGSSGNWTITPSHQDMFNNFCSGNTVKVASVRVFNPVSMRELGCASDACEMTPAAANTLSNCNSATKTFVINNTVLDSSTSNGLVIVGATGLPMHTIRYRVNNGTLERIVNGVTQNLARGVTSINFAYGKSTGGVVKRVDITATGVIAAMKAGEAELGQKTRTLTTSVNLRNSF